MEYRKLGASGLSVSPFCLGTMTFGESQWKLGGVDQATATRMVDMAIDAGINFVDTADVYSAGQSEQMLGVALRGRRQQMVVATKAHGRTGPGPNDRGTSRAHLLAAVEASLQRLGTDYIDLYQVHSWDPATPVEETLAALDQLVRDGKVRYVGLSNWAAWQIAKAAGISAARQSARFISAQMHYSLVNRDLEHEVVPACLDHGIGILVWSPLSGGFLSGKYRSEGAAVAGTRFGDREMWFPRFHRALGFATLGPLEEVAKSHGTSMAAVSLAWVRDRPGVSSVIIGARNLQQLEDNLKGHELQLDPAAVAALEEVTRPEPPYPTWMIQRMTSRP